MGLSQTIRFILCHPMNKGRPLSAIARFAHWQVRSCIRDEVIFDWIDGARLAVRRGMTGATGNIYCGLHEYVDMSFVIDTLTPGDLFVDIGANVGSYTVLASKVCGARTIAVEPDPDTARALRRNIEVNGIQDRVQVFETAVGAQNGTITFTIGRDTVNRVATPEDRDVREVTIQRLDEMLSGTSPTVIKMDVEGYEGEVLQGAGDVLANPALKAIITETRDQKVMGFLNDFGFEEAFYHPDTKKISLSPKYQSNNGLMVRKSYF